MAVTIVANGSESLWLSLVLAAVSLVEWNHDSAARMSAHMQRNTHNDHLDSLLLPLTSGAAWGAKGARVGLAVQGSVQGCAEYVVRLKRLCGGGSSSLCRVCRV